MTEVAQRGQLDASAVAGLLPGFRGQILLPGDEAYEDGRKVWNGSIDRRPAVILRCAGVGDIRAGLAFAKERELPLALRGGGDNFGIVTSFKFRLHSVGPQVFCGLVAWPADQAGKVLRFFRDYAAEVPDLSLIHISEPT